MLRGPDISSWKQLSDARAVKAAGNDFLITKVTGGLSYENPLYGDQIAKARDAGLLIGHYHYLHESDRDPATQTEYVSYPRMVNEAEHFLKYLDWRPGEIVAVDVEDPRVVGDQSEAVLWFCDHVEQALRLRSLIYTFPVYKLAHLTDPRLARYPLWFAEYNDPQIYGTAPWPKWTMRQYTANATVPGISTADIDMNVFDGTAADWRALGSPPAATVVKSPFIEVVRAFVSGGRV